MIRKTFAIIALMLLVWSDGPGMAATATQTLTVNATLNSTAELILGQGAINFPSANPRLTSSIPANEGAVTVTANAETSGSETVTLTVMTNGDLTSGSDAIPAGNITWTASGAGFQAGTMSKTTPQLAGSWVGSGSRSGSLSFFLNNSWNYSTGSYSTQATFTLTAP